MGKNQGEGKLELKCVAMVIHRDVEEFSDVAGIIHIYFDGHKIEGAFPKLPYWMNREGFLS